MPKMRENTLRALLSAQHASALSASSESKLSSARADAMAYYNGDMSKDMPAPVGRSSAVSLDVQDTVEGIMPQLMEVFAGSDEVVKFEPVGPEDVQAAEQETDYINHVFMNQNQGFLALYSFIKDALLQKVGVVKVWWEEDTRESRETYMDKTADEYAILAADPKIEIVEHTANPEGTHDVTVVTKTKVARAKVMGVPPEEFGIERGARNIQGSNYCFHKVVDRTEADLIQQGYDADQVKALPTYRNTSNTEEQARDTVDENSGAPSGVESSGRTVEITEHYCRFDYEGNGKPCLYRVTTGGAQGEILTKNGEPDIVPFDAMPFAAMTPVIVTHRFYGKSLADLVMDIQRIKTALLRGALDSIYIALNPRVVVSENGSSDNTLDDLLVSRPNQIVRVKGDPNSTIAYQVSPDMTKIAFPALEYLDTIKETRTGVSKRGQGIEPDALSNQSATAAKIVENASQARVRLIARIFAETGIRDLFWLLHATIKKHGQQAAVVRLRNNWVTVDPRQWKTREDLTIHVGLGTGGKAQQLMEWQLLTTAQKEAIGAGLVSKRNLFNSGKKLVRILGDKDVETYFVDPSKPPDQQDPSAVAIEPPPDPTMLKAQSDAQAKQAEIQLKQTDLQMRGSELQTKAMLDQQADQRKAEIESVQAQADIATQDRKTQAELALAERKFELERELKLLDFQLKREQHAAEMEMKRELHQHTIAQNQMNMVAGARAHEMKMEKAKGDA